MEFNRRELLKYFGVGATIVPVLGGVPKTELPAKLIEEPRIEVATATIPILPRREYLNREIISVSVDIVARSGHYRFQADSFITDMRQELIELGCRGQFRKWIPGLMDIRWSMEGYCTGMASCEKLK